MCGSTYNNGLVRPSDWLNDTITIRPYWPKLVRTDVENERPTISYKGTYPNQLVTFQIA